MITKTAESLRRGEITAAELARAMLSRIRERAEETNAFITVTEEVALEGAKRADARIRRGDAPMLCGIPCAVKDNLSVAGIPATAASRILEGYVPPYSAFVWERLEAVGALLMGKSNLDEFAMGAGGETSAFGAVKNPHDLSRVAGGSSAGSAAAVADGQAVFALGSDTGGSVRVPAAFCGVVGLKPTYGRISRRGLIAFASSLDTVGVITKTVRDAAIVLDAAAALDGGDMTSLPREDSLADFGGAIKQGTAGLRVGIPAALSGVSPAVAAYYEKAAAAVSDAGGMLTEISLPSLADAYHVYYLISAAEASSNLARYDGIRYGRAGDGASYKEEMRLARERLGDEVKRRLLSGTYALSLEGRKDYYERACALREQMRRTLKVLFQKVDVILLPTTPDTAYPLGEKDGNALPYRQVDSFCTLASLTGVPAISVPFGQASGLPVGMQIIAPAMREDLLFAAASVLEEAMIHD